MGALSFKSMFVPMIKKGLRNMPGGKRQSIRNFRKRPLKVGEPVYLYFGMRTKWCTKLGESVIKSVQEIHISEERVKIYDIHPGDRHFSSKLELRKRIKTTAELNRFAQADGFKDWDAMKQWWKLEHGADALPFTGNLYQW